MEQVNQLIMNIITGYIGANKMNGKIDGYDIFLKSLKRQRKCVDIFLKFQPLLSGYDSKEYLVFVVELKKDSAKEKKNEKY